MIRYNEQLPKAEKGGVSAGLQDGLTMHMKIGEHNPMTYRLDRNPVTGDPLGRISENPVVRKASKGSKSFTIR